MKNNLTINDGTLLVLDVATSSIIAFDADGTRQRTLLAKCGGTPDGIAVDPINRQIYWTNMGEHWDRNDGFIERVGFDGSGRTVIVPSGSAFTPKQLQLDIGNRMLYWSDREGMKVMRCAMDGSGITTLYRAGEGPLDQKDETKHCVGLALDLKRGQIYWTQKGPPDGGRGRILRAGIELPPGERPADRSDVEVLLDELPEPIDLDIHEQTNQLFWTDRGNPPEGNTLNRIGIGEKRPQKPELLAFGLQEAIGLALDVPNDRVFVADLGGNIYSCHLDGTRQRRIFQGSAAHIFTGLAYVKNINL